MSKFGAHVTIGHRDGFGAALAKCHNAGSPVPVLFAVDQDLYPDVKQYSPSTILIFRAKIGAYDNPPAIYQGDPNMVANDWYAQVHAKWEKNPADFHAFSNEPNPNKNDEVQHRWLDAFNLRMMQLAEADGYRLALWGASLGTPDYPDWLYHQASLSHAAQHGHILHLHEPVSGGPDLALRYRKVHDILQPFAPDLPIVISECYGDGLGQWNAYVDSFKAYDAEAMKDLYMWSVCAYQLGGDENWYTAIPHWADYVSATPTPPAPPPPDDREFDRWIDADTGETISTVNPFDLTVTRAGRYRALTRPKVILDHYAIEVLSDGFGTVIGGGQYGHGDVARLEWRP